MLTPRRAFSAVLMLATLAPVSSFAQRPAAGGGGPPAAGGGEQEGLALWLSHTESDNVARVANGVRGSWQAVGVFADAERQSTRFHGSLDGEVEHRWYSIPAVENEWVGSMNALADVQLVSDRFRWSFEGNYGQSRLDAFAPVGPTNRESIVALSTGPQLFIPFGDRTVLTAGGDYTERRYDNSTVLDGESRSLNFALSRRLNETAGIGLFAEREETGFDNSMTAGYEIDTFGVRYDRSLSSGGVLGEVGKNEISYQNQLTDGPFFNFTWNRDLTARSHLSMIAGREYTDSGSLFVATNDGLFEGGALLQSNSPLESKRFSVDYTLTTIRTTIGVATRLIQESYADDPLLDNEAAGLRVFLERTISPLLKFDVAFENLRRDFVTGDRRSTDRWAEAALTRTFGRQLELVVSLAKYDVDSFEERSYEFRLVYWPSR